MKSVEEIIGDKILELLQLGLSKIVKPDITIDIVAELDENQIKKIKQRYGIEVKNEFLKACKEMNVQPNKVLVIGIRGGINDRCEV